MRSICALYTVSEGRGGIDGAGGEGEKDDSDAGGVMGLGDGSGVPDSLRGMRRRRPVGKRRRIERSTWVVAKRVMDSKRG
jgi:hypothetical protein